MGTKNKILIAVILIIVLLSGCMPKKEVALKIDNNHYLNDYIKNNYRVINQGHTDLSILDDSMEGKEIFLTGENHCTKANELLRMKFLKYFKEKTNFKYYLCEMSYSEAFFLNKFLNTGDEKILKEMYKELKGTLAWNKDSYNHWKKLYEYNKSLPYEDKIRVVGIDIEHQFKIAIKYLCEALPEKELPEPIAPIIEELKDIKKSMDAVDYYGIPKDKKLLDFSKRLSESIKKYEKLYREYLGKNYFGFNLVNNNIQYKFETAENELRFNQIRDKRMYENFVNIYNKLPKGKYYGQFGLNHVFQQDQGGVEWVTSLINNSKLKGKILSIVYAYNNCKLMQNRDKQSYEIYSFNTINDKLNIFDGQYSKTNILIKLDGKQSPFNKELIWPFTTDIIKPNKGVTTDYFQYLVIVNNSGACEPLDS